MPTSKRVLVDNIDHRSLIEPATVEDTAEYVAFRLTGAGADHEIFSRESLAAPHVASSRGLDQRSWRRGDVAGSG